MKKKPIIVTYTTEYFPYIGGAEVALRQIAVRLKNEFDFIVITSRGPKIPLPVEQFEEGKVIRLGLGSSLDKWLLASLGHRSIDQILEEHTQSRPMMLWGVDITQGSLAAANAKQRHPKIPFILTVQYGGSPERLRQARLGFIQRSFRTMLTKADYVVTISSYLEAIVREYDYHGHSTIIPNGVDLERFLPRSHQGKRDDRLIVTVSRLVPKNGIDVLLRSIAILVSQGQQVRCLVVGEGPLRSELEHLSSELGIKQLVEFTGNIAHGKLPSYLQKGAVFARPSRSEGLGNVFLEALAAGLSIIGTRVGGITDIIQDGVTGLLVDADDPEDLADKISNLLGDKSLSQDIVSQGLRMIENRFTWDGIADQYRTIFNQMISRQV